MRDRHHLGMALAAAGGALVACHPGPAGVALVVVGLALWRAGHRRSVLVAACLLLAMGWRAEVALEGAGRAHRAMQRALPAPARCLLRGEVVSSPVVQRAGGRGEAGAQARFDLRVDDADCEGGSPPLGARVRLYGADERLGRGDRVQALSTIAPVRLFDNPHRLDPRVRLALTGVTASGGAIDLLRLAEGRGLPAALDRARAFVRERIEATYPETMAPYARALVLGETDLVDVERAAFRDSGLAHLLAVSGTHLVIAVLALAGLLRAVLVCVAPLAARVDVGRLAALVAAGAAWLYADFAGGGGSAYRAAAMMSAAMAVRVIGRRPSGVRCFAWSIAGGVAVQPLALFDLSFLLSLAATAGLLIAAAPLRSATEGRGRAGAAVVLAAGATLAATIACAPVLLSIGPQLPLLGVVTNVLAAPVGEVVALPVGLLHTVLSWAPSAERGAALVAGGALSVVRALAHGTSDSPLVGVALPSPTPWQLAALGVGAVVAALAQRGRARVVVVTLAALLLLEGLARAERAPTDLLRVTVLDVGQGDAILVDLPSGELLLMDAGGLVGSPIDVGERVILPALRDRRRSRIDWVVLSHPHPDHYGGLWAVLDGVEVGEIWAPGIARAERPDGMVARRLEGFVERGVPVRTAPELCGRRRLGGLELDVLAPCPSFDPRHDVNDNSLVLRLRLGRRAALLTGDAERASEMAMLRASPERLRADLLKVGHHGSRTSSTPDFVRAVAPSLAVASCGVRNRFGHPHRRTRRTLQETRVPLLRTDRGGAVIWETDGERIRWQRSRGPAGAL